MGPSRAYHSPDVQLFLSDIGLLHVIAEAMIKIAHPNQHRWIHERRAALWRDRPSTWQWVAPSQSCQLIVNRETLFHRDQHSVPTFFDILVSWGAYENQAYLGLQSLGVAVPYTSGSVSILLARVIEHGVPPIMPERIAFAYFNRVDVCKYWAQGDVEVELPCLDDYHRKLNEMSEEIRLSTM